ncbi:hypothetical protein ACFY2K_26315 [Kitasatospora sp. NPDC001309]|uniref:hypothetical protein n=1 Tax=Kitasatospora sp. NPDC001309 TaxID=3364013 RepID=UPI0036AC144D
MATALTLQICHEDYNVQSGIDSAYKPSDLRLNGKGELSKSVESGLRDESYRWLRDNGSFHNIGEGDTYEARAWVGEDCVWSAELVYGLYGAYTPEEWPESAEPAASLGDDD